jgi:ketosteroid isomerase-like protein
MTNLNGEQSAVDEAVQAWIAAFNEHDAAKASALYHPEAVLWGTTSPMLIASPDGIRNYFERAFQLSPPPRATIVAARGT